MKKDCQIQVTPGDDNLRIPEVGIWAKDKYDLVQTYCDMFTASMKPPKWQCLVYIDLFAGAGLARIRETSEIVSTSALRALDIPYKFNRYIFCDIDSDNIEALRKRVSISCPNIDAHFICNDSNRAISEISACIPLANSSFHVLAFCFVDPYKMDNLAFSTIEKLSTRFMDFLILVPTDMDANRNVASYTSPTNETVAHFLGRPDWRERWNACKQKSFGLFVLEEFSAHMHELDYKPQANNEAVLIRNYQKNAPLYRLAFYSRHDLGKKFWLNAKKHTNPQTNLFE
jgi:three-Cys-motif partner protein